MRRKINYFVTFAISRVADNFASRVSMNISLSLSITIDENCLKAFHIFAISYIYFDIIIVVAITAIISFAE